MNIVEKILKRAFDILSSTIGIIVFLPILIGIAVAIKMDSKGPVFFKQERLGRHGKVFNIYKFRTMIVDAEKYGLGIKTYSEDPRITKVGSFLRKTSLDELPQLFNVFIGNMSVVGPRPPVPYHPYEYKDYNEEQVKRFLVKPGITGQAQVSGRNLLTWDERIVYDVKYVENYNVLTDYIIIIKTIVKVFKREDINSDRHKDS
ncbi:sugar transferase [Nosocomiicoccus sp. HMSC067E10]|uniref:sugar transferase n=1 Tax=Nosocomiicoccus sp. HMSC067E10 TaxID=1739271 RepID=UPI0008A366F1|nr:sugar transferase [Nosocomiicoccus sp. HMSC067E10]OFL46734.1 sugar transferase [Nosocomiicoccus sp. HMSC067E10]